MSAASKISCSRSGSPPPLNLQSCAALVLGELWSCAGTALWPVKPLVLCSDGRLARPNFFTAPGEHIARINSPLNLWFSRAEFFHHENSLLAAHLAPVRSHAARGPRAERPCAHPDLRRGLPRRWHACARHAHHLLDRLHHRRWIRRGRQ